MSIYDEIGMRRVCMLFLRGNRHYWSSACAPQILSISSEGTTLPTLHIDVPPQDGSQRLKEPWLVDLRSLPSHYVSGSTSVPYRLSFHLHGDDGNDQR